MSWRVQNYDLKKRYSRLAVGMNDNYDLKKKQVQSSGGFTIMSGKKRFSRLAISGNVWGGSTSSDILAGAGS